MPTILGDEFPPCKIITPPGMSNQEILLWHRFQKLHCIDWLRVYYNVRVGEGIRVPDHYEDEIKKDWMFLTMHRIDALVETDDNIILTEVRPDAGRSALGACLVYLSLYSKDVVIKKPLHLAVVTNMISTELVNIFKDYDIETFIV